MFYFFAASKASFCNVHLEEEWLLLPIKIFSTDNACSRVSNIVKRVTGWEGKILLQI